MGEDKTIPPQPAGAQRVQPQAIEAEMALLGSLMLGEGMWIADALALVRGEMFYREINGLLFEEIRKLYSADTPVDLATVMTAARDGLGWFKEDPARAQAYIVELADSMPTASAIMHYAGIVVEKWRLREAIRIASELAAAAYEGGEDSLSLSATAQAALVQTTSTAVQGEWEDSSALVSALWDDLSARYERAQSGESCLSGITTGFVDLDAITGGLKPGMLTILGARPSMGKTSLAMEMGARTAEAGSRVAVFSLEMPARDLMERMVSSKAKVDGSNLKRGLLEQGEWESLQAATTRVYDLPLFVQDEPDVTLSQIEASLRALIHKAGSIDLVIVDYLTLVKQEGRFASDTSSSAVGEIAKGLKNLARRYDCHVICLAQLSRSVERREDKRPMLSDLRESGNIEEAADLALMIYRPAYYARKEEYEGDGKAETEEAEIIVAKQRNGATGTVTLDFTPAYTRFDDHVETVY